MNQHCVSVINPSAVVMGGTSGMFPLRLLLIGSITTVRLRHTTTPWVQLHARGRWLGWFLNFLAIA